MRYLDFTLDFVPDGRGGVAVKVSDSPAGQGGLEPFDPPPTEEDAPLGALLFDALFRGSLRRFFDRSVGSLRPNEGLRIKIQLDLAETVLAPLHSLPWESLFERETHHTFGLDRRFSIVRFVPLRRMLDRRELPRPLRILLAGAEPRGTRLLALDEEMERVLKAVERPGRIEVRLLPQATPESLRRTLTEGGEFHVLHFMGHGDFDPASGEGKLFFEDGRRGAAKLLGHRIADRLRDRTSLRLIFLNACRTGRSAAPNPFGGVAMALVEAGVPAVLAMQRQIADGAAIAFSETVYRRLAAGDSIDAAVTEGRHALAARNPESPDWSTPVLLSHVPDGRLFLPAPPRAEPPQAAGPVPRPLHQLPSPPADFVGRTGELADLRAAMASGGAAICALLGMGGVGKTALALKVAHEFRDAYPDGQIYLDLRGLSEQPLSADEAAAHVIRSFHPEDPLPDGPRLAALYREVLHDRRVLLLMDNAAGRDQIEPLIPPESCALLVTSRRRFSLPGGFHRDLEQLPALDACALLRRISPRAAEWAPTIEKLCGGLPFALRGAGSTLAERPDLAVSQFVRRLEGEGQRAKLGEAVVGVSYALLSESLRARFRALSAFPAAFDAAAAGAVWDLPGPEETDDALGELIRWCLLEGEEGRYRLHDLARAFAGANLTREEEEGCRARHASHYLGSLSEADDLYLRGNEGILRGLSLFDRERAHILAAQAWSAARAEASTEAARLAARFPSCGAQLSKLRLSPREQLAWAEAGLAAARRLGDRSHEGALHGQLGIAYAALGETRRAIECFEQHLAISRETGDRRGQANALGNLGNAYAELGETRRAIDLFEHDLALRRELGDRRGEGNALGNLGTAHADLGEIIEAIGLYRQRIEIAHEIGDRRGAANASWNLGAAYETLGELARAIDHMQACVDFEREIGHPDADKDAAHVEELRDRRRSGSPSW